MEYLNRLYSSNPNIRFIDLTNREITDLSKFLPLLSKFRLLVDLELSDNRLTGLPEDLSCLQHIQSLNITGNIFSDFEQAIAALKTLPKLTKLSLNLESKENVKLVLDNLPLLSVLNNQRNFRKIFK